MNEILNKIYHNSKKIQIDNYTKIVIMSDCHRGNGNSYDNFKKNKKIYEKALNYYYKNNFKYIELGDGDEMWEVSNYKDIIDEYLPTFKLLKKFHDSNRLIMIYGNHDICKKSKEVLEKYFYYYYDEGNNKIDLLSNLISYESIILEYNNFDIFLIHGHQVDLLNSKFWKLSRFLVRHIWKNFEFIGIKDPTKEAKNYKVNKKGEKILEKWSMDNNIILIAGHTHRPIFPKVGKSMYFNDGSCIHPNGITCLEIENGTISLIKWIEDEDYIKRIEIAKKKQIEDFYSK